MITPSQLMRRKKAMKNKILGIFLPLLAISLSSCGANRELYKAGQYDSANYEENYYTSWNNVEKITPDEVKEYNVTPSIDDPIKSGEALTGLRYPDQYTSDNELLEWNSDTPVYDKGIGYGPTKNLTTIDNSFAYGYLSKLYDGRVRCDGYYTRSRVQLDKRGYATYFPKALSSYKYFAFSVRGGTGSKYESTRNIDIKVTYHVSFYVKNMETNKYTKYVFNMADVKTQTNNGGRTSLLSFYFDDVLGDNWATLLKGTTAMSMTYELSYTPYADLVDDKEAEGCHFSVMLYEVLLPESTWN